MFVAVLPCVVNRFSMVEVSYSGRSLQIRSSEQLFGPIDLYQRCVV